MEEPDINFWGFPARACGCGCGRAGVWVAGKVSTNTKADHKKKREEYLEELRKVHVCVNVYVCTSVGGFVSFSFSSRRPPPYTLPHTPLRTPLIGLQVKARREEYEREREERDAKRIEDQRQREAELHGDWQEKEEEFHRIQSKRRCVFCVGVGVCCCCRVSYCMSVS